MSVKIREKNLNDGRRSLYLDIYHKGHRSYEFLNLYLTTDRHQNKEARELAENIRAKRLLEMQSMGHGFPPSFKKKVNFLDYFKQSYEAKVKNEGLRGLGSYEATHKHLEGFTKGLGIPIGAIDEKWLEDFKAYLLDRIRQNTVILYYAKVKAVLRRGIKEGYITRNPGENVKSMPVPEVEKAFLTSEEVSKLAATPCKYPDLKRAFLFACCTGLRISDVKALTWGDIKDGKIHFKQKKTQGFEYMPLNSNALAIIAQCRGDKEIPLAEKQVFDIPNTKHISPYLTPWIKAAGITKKITFHCSRHTFATSLLTAGTDLYTTSKLLGHKSIASTAIYAKIVDEKKQNAVDRLPIIDFMA